MRFEFATATRVLFGPGTVWEVPPLAAGLGRRAFVVIGRSLDRVAPLLDPLKQHGVDAVLFNVLGEPTTDIALEAVQRARENGCDFVIGMGGGSSLDLGKAVAALLTNRGELLDYLEVIGRGQTLSHASAPYIAIPTTAGTGSEVTRNAVLASPEHRVKVSLRSPLMLPRLAVVDPELTYSMPSAITASTGLDALAQNLEPYVSRRANPMTSATCREGMRRAARSLRRAYKDGNDAAAREDMALASLFGGLALANAGLGAVHGLAGPLGGLFPAPHGVVCARLLPYVMKVNLHALQARMPDSPAVGRYEEIAQILTGNTSARATDGINWVQGLCEALEVPRLSDFGLTPGDFQLVVEMAQKASSMQGNPIRLTDEELTHILTQAL